MTTEPLYLAAPIRFIKQLRTHYGMSLLEAKHVTDKLRRPGIALPNEAAYDNGIERMFRKGYLVDSLKACFADYNLDTDAATYMRGKIVDEDVPFYTISAWNEWVTRFNETAVYNPFYGYTDEELYRARIHLDAAFRARGLS